MKADLFAFRRLSSRKSPHLHYSEWQAEYQAAISELELNRLFDRVADAEVAIFNRLQFLSGRISAKAERQAITDAVAALRVIKRDRLALPDWEPGSGDS
jgi:hypothetical protein